MIPVWFWERFGVRKLVPGEPLKYPINDLIAITSYQDVLTEHQNRKAQQGNHTNQPRQNTYMPTSVSPPLWRI
jgi:hypothetical protein